MCLENEICSLKIARMEAENLHKSVLLNQVVQMFDPQSDEIFVDCTLGLGGHTEAILQTAENTQVIGIDQDAEAIKLAKARLENFGERVKSFTPILPKLKRFWNAQVFKK